MSARKFFDPCICSIEKENWLSHNCQRRSRPCACIFDKFFFTKPIIPLQSVRIRKGFGAEKIKNFSIPLITVRISFSIVGLLHSALLKLPLQLFAELFYFLNFEDDTPMLSAGIYLKN